MVDGHELALFLLSSLSCMDYVGKLLSLLEFGISMHCHFANNDLCLIMTHD